MKVVIVGKRNGKREIQWLNFFLLAFALGIIGGLLSGCIYYLLCQRWSHEAVISGVAIMVGMMFFGLIKSLGTPIDKLRQL
jgi:ABC-type uncharacterized transport system permease subunit